jgi:hypothetical protein
MERNLNLTIPTPCDEKWENFSMTSSGGFCSSCNKTVVDLTKMSDRELLKYLQQRTSHTCGRVRRDQVKSYASPLLSTRTLLRAAVVSLFCLMISKPAVSQISSATSASALVQNNSGIAVPVVSVTIKGVVKASEDGEVVPGVSIYQKGTTTGTLTDANGKFEFPKPLNEGDVLVFSFLGSKTIEYLVTGKETEPITILLEMDSIIMGELAIEECLTTEKSGLKGWWAKVKDIF